MLSEPLINEALPGSAARPAGAYLPQPTAWALFAPRHFPPDCIH